MNAALPTGGREVVAGAGGIRAGENLTVQGTLRELLQRELQHIQMIAKKIHLSVTDNDKRLKNAELMLSHTAFRLGEMLQASSVDDRPLFQQTLAQVTDAQNATMMQVFRSK